QAEVDQVVHLRHEQAVRLVAAGRRVAGDEFRIVIVRGLAQGDSRMRTHTFLAVLAVLLSAPLARATDLTKIDRRIAREPAYQTKSPRCCLLVFGLEARTRVWLVQDGDTLYVDRDGTGDLTGDGKRVKVQEQGDSYRSFAAGDLTIDGLTHTGLTVTQSKA